MIQQVQPNAIYKALRALENGGSPGGFNNASQFLAHAKQTKMDLNNCFAHFSDSDNITSTAMLIPQAGRSAMLFTSKPKSEQDINNLAQSIDATSNFAPQQQLAMAQALINPQDQQTAQSLLNASYTKLTNLDYLGIKINTKPTPPIIPDHIELWQYKPSLKEHFIDALDRSYINTKDCLKLQGIRNTQDVFEGHMSVGNFSENLWHLLRINGHNAGVLLLNPIIHIRCIELVYIGICNDHRGQGLGKLLLNFALYAVNTHGYNTLTLAVDQDNAPAKKLYQNIGMKLATTRTAYIKAFVKPQSQN